MASRIRLPGLPFRRFRVFLSYAREQRATAELLVHTLEREGQEVFFDGHDLPPGEAFTARIRENIERADLFVFLISPDSVSPGTFALTELGMAVKKWGSEEGGILGVMAVETDSAAVPAALRAITYLVPQGDLVAETANEVSEQAGRRRRRGYAFGGAGTVAVALACAAVYAAASGLRDAPAAEPAPPVVAVGGAPADSVAVDDSADAREAANAPTREELVAFQVSRGDFHLKAPEWLAEADRWARENPLRVSGEQWLEGVGVSRWPTTKVGKRPISPEYGVFHYTVTEDAGMAVRVFRDSAFTASAHLVIGEDGSVAQLAPFDRATWHAGRSASGSTAALNSRSIGIDLVNWGALRKSAGGFDHPVRPNRLAAAPDPVSQRPAYWEEFTEPQLFRALQVARLLHERYRLKDVLGHHEVQGDRKQDPGPAFPLALFRAALAGGGDANRLAADSYRRALVMDPANAPAREGLRAVVSAYVERADSALARNDRPAAEASLAAAAELAPGDARVDRLRALLRGAPAP